MSEQSSDTKQRIIEAARMLFSEHGFEGTSVRDIAQAAEVNVASVNYHFSSKEKLFAEILKIGYFECTDALRQMYLCEDPSLEDALIFLFQYFTQKSHDLVTYFKMMMSSQHSHHQVTEGSEDEFFGPPGGKLIVDIILKEAQGPVCEEDLHWALKTLFSHVVHTSIMYNCCFKQNSAIPFSSTADLEKNIRRLTNVVLKELGQTN